MVEISILHNKIAELEKRPPRIERVEVPVIKERIKEIVKIKNVPVLLPVDRPKP